MSTVKNPESLFIKSIKTDSDLLAAAEYLDLLKESNFGKKNLLLKKYSRWQDFTDLALEEYKKDRALFLKFIEEVSEAIHGKEKINVEVKEIPPKEFTEKLFNILENKLDFDFIIDYKVNSEVEEMNLSVKGKYLQVDLKTLLKNYIIKTNALNTK